MYFLLSLPKNWVVRRNFTIFLIGKRRALHTGAGSVMIAAFLVIILKIGAQNAVLALATPSIIVCYHA